MTDQILVDAREAWAIAWTALQYLKEGYQVTACPVCGAVGGGNGVGGECMNGHPPIPHIDANAAIEAMKARLWPPHSPP